eukprot:6642900-Alexandrium_andersonii.AAC.1
MPRWNSISHLVNANTVVSLARFLFALAPTESCIPEVTVPVILDCWSWAIRVAASGCTPPPTHAQNVPSRFVNEFK